MKYFLLITIFFSVFFPCKSQTTQKPKTKFIVMFYNLENLFDTIDNPLTKDDEYIPSGVKYWTPYRYKTKLQHIRQVICAVDYTNYPDIIGVCEVENKKVLEDLISRPPLKKAGYKIFHRESLDRRGIDNAVLYNPETFKILDTNILRINFKNDPEYHTRDIIYVKGIERKSKDTLHIFVNHWPSRYGGQVQTEDLRCAAAKKLKSTTDSILKINSSAKILCIGDFNDTPADMSMLEFLKAGTYYQNANTDSLYNIAYYLQYEKKLWTYAYRLEYDILDQVIVSGQLLKPDNLYINKDEVYPLKYDFMIKKDDLGYEKPKRTYLGYKYEGGFSDHLPMIINFSFEKNNRL